MLIGWTEFLKAHQYTNLKTLEKVSDYIMRQQNSLYAHISRADNDDIMKNVTVNHRLEPPKQALKRSERLRGSWVWKTMSTLCRHSVMETSMIRVMQTI